VRSEKMNKQTLWTIRITLGIFGLVTLFQIVPNLQYQLEMLSTLISNAERTTEYKIIIVVISIYLSCVVCNTIVNIIYKLHKLLERKIK